MSISLIHVLHRIGRLRQRFEAERRASAHNTMRLLKLRSVILKAERRLQQLTAARSHANRRLKPVLVRSLPLASRG